jgi:hypothetical protein
MRTPHDPRTPDFGRISAEHAATFVGIINTLHNGPTAPAFGRLLMKKLEADDYVLLAHLFEEMSVMALHRLVPEALLFDAFAFDLYWDELREDVLAVRAETGNEKFCENFEIAAERARDYRQDRPPKLRWKHSAEGEEPPDPAGGLGVRRPRRPPQGSPSSPDSSPVPTTEG